MFTEIFGGGYKAPGGVFSDTNWITNGITFINGSSENGKQRCRQIILPSFTITVVSFNIIVPSLKVGEVKKIMQFPKLLSDAQRLNTQVLNYIALVNYNSRVDFDFTSDGQLQITARYDADQTKLVVSQELVLITENIK